MNGGSFSKQSPSVAILGTGDFSRALCSRLVDSGYQVTLGSRRPERRNLVARSPRLTDVQVLTIEAAVNDADVIFLAIPAEAMQQTLESVRLSLQGKILVDVSNTTSQGSTTAERLQEGFPECAVVKGFNTLRVRP
jgi:metalloreductase STEAP3